MIDIDGLREFLVVSELKGFRAAACQLGVSPSAVSHAIKKLEVRIGAPLLARNTRSVSLTEAGERLLAHALPAMDLMAAGFDAAAELAGAPSGHLRINAPRPSLPLLLNRLFPAFGEAYPNINLELIGEDRLVDIVDQRFDAGIRLGHIVERDMVSLWLTRSERFIVVGSPALLDRVGIPATPEGLSVLPTVVLKRDKRTLQNWEFERDGETTHIQVAAKLLLNDADRCIQAALQGVGLIYTLQSLVETHIECGNLCVVLPDYGREIPGLCLYYPSRSQSLPKLRAFVDFLTQRMRAGRL